MVCCKFCLKAVATEGSGPTHLFPYLKQMPASQLDTCLPLDVTRPRQPTNTCYKAATISGIIWSFNHLIMDAVIWHIAEDRYPHAKNWKILLFSKKYLMKVMLTLYQSQWGNWSVFIKTCNLTCKIYVYKSILSKRLSLKVRCLKCRAILFTISIKIKAMLSIISLSFVVYF